MALQAKERGCRSVLRPRPVFFSARKIEKGSMRMKITCAIFDADGTLLDSMPMWKAITYEYAQDRGLDAPPACTVP